MGFPSVIVECAFSSILPESTSAPTGFSDITKYVDTISGTLRGRSYELDDIETGSINLTLDNSDGRFTPGSPNSPYYPFIKANRRLRIRGKNLQRPNIARAGGHERTTEGFFRGDEQVLDVSDGVTYRVIDPTLATHNALALGFTGALLNENTHIEGTLKAGATAGTYRVLSWWVPIELGVRLAHSAHLWRISGTEPASTVVKVQNNFYDADGNLLPKPDGEFAVQWNQPSPTSPNAFSFTDFPPGDAAYGIQHIDVTLTSTLGTDLVYAIFGLQSEFPTANHVPSVSGWYDASAWSVDGSGTALKAGADAANAYLNTTWAADDTELSTVIPRLVPGEEYTYVVEAWKSGGPDILVSADDGLTGVTLSSNSTWTTMRTTFTAERPEQPIKFIPQGAIVVGQTLRLRLSACTYSNPSLPLAAWAGASDVTDWERPIPVFDGWVERWPIRTTASASTISITANDRLKKLGEVVMESTLKQALISDGALLIVPFTDDPLDSGGDVSIQGDWADDAGISQVAPQATKNGASSATFTLGGIIGPTDEDAVLLDQAAVTQGYVFPIPYSNDYVVPAPPVTSAPKPVPKPNVVRTYKKTYYATWSRSFDGSNATRWDDSAHLYQGDSGEDANGNQRSLFGFNWNSIKADLTGASVLGASVSLYALHWWYYAGGTAYLGTHTKTAKPSSYDNSGIERRWRQTKWSRNAWRTVNIGAAGGVLFKTGSAKGIVVGWGDDDRQTYGYFAGATEKRKPYLTITYKK